MAAVGHKATWETFELIVFFPNLSFLGPPFYLIHEFIQQIFTEFCHLTGHSSE